jgi:hypothetical protein
MALMSFRGFVVLCVALASPLFALPARLFDAVGRFLISWPDAKVVRFIADLTRGPVLVTAGPGQQIEPAHYQRNRHEAGLARLGTVRHI